MDYQRLRTEVTTDPATLGYAGKSDQAVADLLNSTTTNRTQPRTQVTKNEILNAIRNADYPSTSAQDQIRWNKLNLLLSTDTIDPSNQNIRDVFAAVFAGTTTLANLQALASRPVSRADEIGIGFVTPGDVGLARGGVW